MIRNFRCSSFVCYEFKKSRLIFIIQIAEQFFDFFCLHKNFMSNKILSLSVFIYHHIHQARKLVETQRNISTLYASVIRRFFVPFRCRQTLLTIKAQRD